MSSRPITQLTDTPYIRLYEVLNEGDKLYLCASRRTPETMPAAMDEATRNAMLPDAVSLFVTIQVEGQQPQLLLSWEYRYPVGQYLLSVPAGLIDPQDLQSPDPLRLTAQRELQEECGIQLQPQDQVCVVNPLVWSTPGLTDESNALVSVDIRRKEMPALSQVGAEGTEAFDGFLLVSREQARQLLASGRDPKGGYYPLFTWAALMHFVGQAD